MERSSRNFLHPRTNFLRGMMKKPGGKLVFPDGKLKKNLRQSDLSRPEEDYQVQKDNSHGSRITGEAVVLGQDRVVGDVDGEIAIQVRICIPAGAAEFGAVAARKNRIVTETDLVVAVAVAVNERDIEPGDWGGA